MKSEEIKTITHTTGSGEYSITMTLEGWQQWVKKYNGNEKQARAMLLNDLARREQHRKYKYSPPEFKRKDFRNRAIENLLYTSKYDALENYPEYQIRLFQNSLKDCPIPETMASRLESIGFRTEFTEDEIEAEIDSIIEFEREQDNNAALYNESIRNWLFPGEIIKEPKSED